MTEDLIGVDAADLQRQLAYAARLENTIVDLEAERDELQLAYDALMSVVDQQKRGMDELIAERDELRRELTGKYAPWAGKRHEAFCPRVQCQGAAQRLMAERDRYRAALGRIAIASRRAALCMEQTANIPGIDNQVYVDLREMAIELRDALSGGTDD